MSIVDGLLPSPLEQLWIDYQQNEVPSGQPERMRVLEIFLEALKPYSVEEYQEWAYSLCGEVVDNKREIPIRLPLFRDALFPPLLEGVKTSRPGCARWLGGLADHLYKCPDLRARLSEFGESKYALLKLALRHGPGDQKAMLLLINAIFSWLEYATHELPSGVLCGSNMSVPDCCAEYLEDTAELENLAVKAGVKPDYEAFIQSCQFHFTHYPVYYARHRESRSYAEYLRDKSLSGSG